MEYKTKLTQNLALFYQQYEGKLAKQGGFPGILYLSMKREIPKFLMAIDENEEMRNKVEEFLKELVKALGEKDGAKL